MAKTRIPPVRVAIVYHNHQPGSQLPGTNTLHFPYVRKHALRAYHDMPLWSSRAGVKTHFNLTPILIDQLQLLASGKGDDRHLQLTRIPASRLTEAQKLEILQQFFEANLNVDHAIRKTGSLGTLYDRLAAIRDGRPWHTLPPATNKKMTRAFTTQDYRDIQVLGNLAMFGVETRNGRVAQLIAKGKGYTEADKREVIEEQFKIIRAVLDQYKRLQDDGMVEILTSPYHHPIMPLICDSEHYGKPSVPHGWLVEYRHADDVRQQLHMAGLLYEKTFGRTPGGLWPSEGSVCNEIFLLLAEALPSVRYVLTDAENFARSRLTPTSDWKDNFVPWPFINSKIYVVGRDRGLSDRIGWVRDDQYAQTASNLIGDILAIRDGFHKGPKPEATPLVVLVLDGENMQESRANDAHEFYVDFYEGLKKLEEQGKAQTVLLSEALGGELPSRRIQTLWPGSWIGCDFTTWAGEELHVLPWAHLAIASEAIDNHSSPDERVAAQGELNQALRSHQSLGLALSNLSPLAQALAYKHAAQTSCYMWWYGGRQGRAADLGGFDRLYRINLSMVYENLGLGIPSDLHSSFYPGGREEFSWVASLEPLALLA